MADRLRRSDAATSRRKTFAEISTDPKAGYYTKRQDRAAGFRDSGKVFYDNGGHARRRFCSIFDHFTVSALLIELSL